MKKLLNISVFSAITLFLIASVLCTICILWDVQDGLLIEVEKYSLTGFVIMGSIWILAMTYNILSNDLFTEV